MAVKTFMFLLSVTTLSNTYVAYAACKSDEVTSECSDNGDCADDTCSCKAGFVGEFCQAADPCRSGTCNAQGNCSASDTDLSQTTCSCNVGYGGSSCNLSPSCQTDSDCKNGGTCFKDKAPYLCSCKLGFWGVNCQNAADSVSTANGFVLIVVLSVIKTFLHE